MLLFINQSCILFELRAKENEASKRKGVAGSPGSKTPKPASKTQSMPKIRYKTRIRVYWNWLWCLAKVVGFLKMNITLMQTN